MRPGKNPYFSDSEYQKEVAIPTANNSSSEDEKSPEEKAFETANDCRKFETEHFWQRGTYYWAFILASFTAHFTCLGNFTKEQAIDFNEIKSFPWLSLLILAVTAFFCFFFSWSWVIVNKGSRFWQKNWERHIDNLEGKNVGHLFNVIMNENNKSYCSPNIFSCKPYRYSLAKSTQMTGIFLMVVSFAMFVFYLFILCEKVIPVLWILFAIIILLVIIVGLFLLRHFFSKPKKKTKDNTEQWYRTY